MRSLLFSFLSIFLFIGCSRTKPEPKIFDVHLHGSGDPAEQINSLKNSGVYKAAVSTSWEQQKNYRKLAQMKFLYGLMFPCPNGKVPYSLQPCFGDGQDWPPVSWVEQEIAAGRIDFLGEILTQYYGISSSDTTLYPYLALAEKYQVPVGFHTGGAGPDHGSPDFKLEMGDPTLLEPVLQKFPRLKVWIMHAGDQFYKEAAQLMKKYAQVYADISVISNPAIVPAERFQSTLKYLVDEGLAERLMFGTDNGEIGKVIAAIEAVPFLSGNQKTGIYYANAERFFDSKQINK